MKVKGIETSRSVTVVRAAISGEDPPEVVVVLQRGDEAIGAKCRDANNPAVAEGVLGQATST